MRVIVTQYDNATNATNNQLIDQQSINWLIDRTINRLIESIDQSTINWLIDQLI